MKTVRVLAIRRDAEQITPHEMAALRNTFPGMNLEVLRADPMNRQEHAECCRKMIRPKEDVVLLPGEEDLIPQPALAIEEGFVHVAVIGNRLCRVLSIKRDVAPFH